MLLAFLLGALVTTGLINIWETYLIAALRGAVMSFNLPARQSIISELVPKKDLPNAIALNSATMNLTRVLGPSMGGVLIALFGVDWLFYLNGLSFLAILYTLRLMHMERVNESRAAASPWQELAEGIRFLRGNKFLRYLVLLAVVPMFFGQPYITMLTVFARDVLVIGPAGLGLLTSTASIGSITGALVIAGWRRTQRVNFMLGGIMFFGFFLLLFSLSHWVLVSLVFLFLAGAGNTAYNSTNNSLLQMNVPDAYRGRVLSLLFINRGMVPLGTALTGLLAETFGAPFALGSMSAMLIVLAVAATILRPHAAETQVTDG
jgi:MFS family permease